MIAPNLYYQSQTINICNIKCLVLELLIDSSKDSELKLETWVMALVK